MLQNELMSIQDEGKVLSSDLTTSRMRVSELENLLQDINEETEELGNLAGLLP